MKKLLPIFILILLCNFVAAQVSKTVNVTTPGTLSTLLSDAEKTTVTNLNVTGIIDARDIKCMRDEMTVLAVIDISAVTINAYYGTDGTTPYFPDNLANEMPWFSFSKDYQGNTTLKSITLPNSITSIGFYAFQSNTALEYVCIPKSVDSIKTQAFIGCSALKTIKCFNSVPPTLGLNCFFTLEYSTAGKSIVPDAVYIPIGSLNAYQTASGWKDLTNFIEYALTVRTLPVSSITLSGALLNANLDLIIDTPVSAHGFCWNTTGSPTIADTKVDNGAKTTPGAFSDTISGLPQGTKYYVKAYATDGESTVYGSEVSFTTASMPVAAGVISGAQTVCQGQSTVTYTVPTIAYATSYIWTLPSGITGTSSTNSITVNYAKTFSTGSITVKGHNDWGDGIASTLDITANLLPVTAGTISGNKTVCQGESSVTYTVPDIVNATSYTWVLPAGVTGSSTTNSITVNYSRSAVSGNITVKGHNDCGDGIVSYSTVTVNQLPVIELSDTAVISGGMVPLFPTITYTGTGNLSYKWTPSTGLNSDTIAQPFATVTGKTTYTLVVTTPGGCSDSAHVTVNISPMAQPQIGIVGVTGSNKNRVVWNKPVTTGIASYFIYKETTISNVFEKIGTVPYDSLSIYVDNQSFPDVKSDNYKLSIFDSNGIESPLSDAHKTMHLSINKGQNATWNLIWEPYEGFYVSTYNIYRGTTANNLSFYDATSGSSTQYSDLSAPAGDVYYQMEVVSSTLINPTKAPDSMQKSKVSENSTGSVLVSYNSSRSNIATNSVSGVNELTGESKQINIYPNPVKDYLRIDFEGGSTFEILNLMGQVVYTGDLNKNSIVQTSSLSPGVYMIKFTTGRTFEYRKIIKE